MEDGQITSEHGLQVKAFWFQPIMSNDGQWLASRGFSTIMLGVQDAEVEEIKPDYFTYTTADDAWHLVKRDLCPHFDCCEIARRQVGNMPTLDDPDSRLEIDQRRDAAEAHACHCICYGRGQDRAHLIWTLFQMLRADGAHHTVVDRRLRASGHRRNPQHKQEQERRARNATQPIYVRISLNQRVHVRRNHDANGQSTLTVSDELPGHSTRVMAHWRLLVPGEGRPWKGGRPRVVEVSSHDRYIHGARRVRYHVTP